MARINKTFRPTEEIAQKLKERAAKEGVSESDLINAALNCYLGIQTENNCTSINNEINNIKSQLDKLISLNNLKTS
ncbi:MAG: CopG family transcriptional regulator [Cyanobacteria bacterium J06633_8]